MWGYFFVIKEEYMEEKYQIHKKKCDGKFYAILSFDNKTLRAELKRLGLDFQTVKGLWKD